MWEVQLHVQMRFGCSTWSCLWFVSILPALTPLGTWLGPLHNRVMENVPPSPMNGDKLPTLDELLRPNSKRNAKASRQKRSPAPSARPNVDPDDEESHTDSGLLTPPSSLTQEDNMDASRMLFSPPPEEVLRNVRNSVSVQVTRSQLVV